MPFDMQPVSNPNSHVESTGYDAESQIMRVKFDTGRTYDYHNVPEFMARDIRTAGHPGNYLHKIVAPAHPASEVK